MALGPIDPQVFNGELWVPALGYLEKVEELLAKSLHQFNAQLATNSARGRGERVEANTAIRWVQYPIQLTPAGVHHLRHLVLAQVLLFHGLLKLPGQDALHGKGRRLFQGPLILQVLLERRADTSLCLAHDVISFARFLARAKSGLGVF